MQEAADTWRFGPLTNISLLLWRNLVTPSAAANQYCQEASWEQTFLSLPLCRNLYEVFCNVRDDEQEHVKTMHACADYSIVEQIAKMKVRVVWGCTRHLLSCLVGRHHACQILQRCFIATAKVGRDPCEHDASTTSSLLQIANTKGTAVLRHAVHVCEAD